MYDGGELKVYNQSQVILKKSDITKENILYSTLDFKIKLSGYLYLLRSYIYTETQDFWCELKRGNKVSLLLLNLEEVNIKFHSVKTCYQIDIVLLEAFI